MNTNDGEEMNLVITNYQCQRQKKCVEDVGEEKQVLMQNNGV